MYELIIPPIVAFAVTFLFTKFLIDYLTFTGSMVQDAPKPGKVMLPRPGGPALIAGMVAGGLATYAFIPMNEILLYLVSISIAFVVGFIDDKKVMKGWFKPTMLIVASIPLLFMMSDMVVPSYGLSLPLFGYITVPLLYGLLIIASVPLIGNTSNSLDVYNGVVTKSFLIAFAFLFICIALTSTNEVSYVGIPIIASMFAFHHFHKYPSRIFPGDSGAIVMGTAFIGFAIISHAEILAIIAILPAILNSFLYLASNKKLREHREIKNPSARINEDGTIEYNKGKTSTSLIRLILAQVNKPMTELQISRSIYGHMILAGILSVITALATSLDISALIIGGVIGACWAIKFGRTYWFVTLTWGLVLAGIFTLSVISNASHPDIPSELLHVALTIPLVIGGLIGLKIIKKISLGALYKRLEETP